LTDKGRALEGPLRALGEWASAWIEPVSERAAS
jgi:DNA-binding HxlR family transcriptional regulator